MKTVVDLRQGGRSPGPRFVPGTTRTRKRVSQEGAGFLRRDAVSVSVYFPTF